MFQVHLSFALGSFVFFSTPVPSSCTRSADHEVVSSSSPAAVCRSPWPPALPRPLPPDHSCLAGPSRPRVLRSPSHFLLTRGHSLAGKGSEGGPPRGGANSHLPPSAADFSVSSFIFST
uniref:Putative secreted protein n=1 Tax=Ixodes ricinus TaxID=34613 RepID=A0A6B0ULX9_IXORI